MLGEKGYLIENIDATVIAQAPKIGPYREQMRERIAKALGITVGQVSIKATTEEGLGFTGRGEGIAATAICMLTSPFDLSMQTVNRDCGSCGGCERR
jgi:2-C-methyl-D-erythritol 2,4-cyclodiphosphate synthase